MINLRLQTITVISSTEIEATFTLPLSQLIETDNISIVSQTSGVPDPEILQINIVNNIITLTVQPLTNLAVYLITFKSTQEIVFASLHNDAILLEDGVGNQQFLIGPIESSNIVKNYFNAYLHDNVYNLDGNSTLNKYLNILATLFSRSLFDIRQARNDNYLSFTVIDEPLIRDAGGFDRLNQEGAYEILRVGKTPTGTTGNKTISFDGFPTIPITLLQQNTNENLVIGSSANVGTFNINDLILNLSKHNLTKILSITFTYSNGHLPYVYDISKFGYQILDSKYDSLEAFSFLQLTDNQAKLNTAILNDPTFSLKAIFQVQVFYQYKDLGRFVDQSSVLVDSIVSSGREVLPPLKNIFNLKHAPVVDANDNIGSLGDITFVDQNVLTVLNQKHPAFINEIPFRLDFLPSSAGQYAVDYATGTVYVFGSDGYQTGTGATPPLAIYDYRLIYTRDIDYVIDDNNDMAAIPTGNIFDAVNNVNVIFDFAKVLAQNIDYIANLHKEVLNERVNNNFIALNALKTQFAPITNVFKIFNETTGEIYRLVRWSNDKVFFAFNSPPNIEEIVGERATFELINNEVMIVSEVLTSIIINTQIFKISLNNNNLISQSQDCIGSVFNSSVSISDRSIFVQEKYFDPILSLNTNLSQLTTVGDFCIDYADGIVYLLTGTSQDFDIGAISYRHGIIIPEHPHITSVDDIFYRILLFGVKNKHFDFISFEDGKILPKTFDRADEQTLLDSATPYVISNQVIGAFVDTQFTPGVSNSINFIRFVFENSDLQNNTLPINFAPSSTFTGQNITVSPLTFIEYHSIGFNGSNFTVVLNTGSNYLSPNIQIDISVIRFSDSVQLWNGTGTIVPGNLLTLILPNTMSPALNDSVRVVYTFTINNLSNVIVDYDKGGYFIDYTAITDEVLISYEYGDNVLDFRSSNALSTGDQYFVTYKVGALRDALLKNFGSLINIDLLNKFEISLNRERYRDALMAAMHTFPKGPTLAAIQELVTTITHVPPEIIELVFQSWSLGNSLLQSREAKISGDVQFLPTKFGNGASIDANDQDISFPGPANIKLENGTLETWIVPKWNGIDNFAELEFNIAKDGYALPDNQIFIGALEYHPTLLDTSSAIATIFKLNKDQKVDGIPSKNKNGVFIYYDLDVSGLFNRWFVDVIDGYFTDGYITDGYVNKNYQINISSNGKFYDVKSTLIPKPTSSHITSANDKIKFKVISFTPNEGITFVADIPHYLIDFAQNEHNNRFSIFKDESGYLNFKVYDKFGNTYLVSTDVSSWRYGQPHHIAVGWKINTKILRDELHLFIDGVEIPNIIKYGDRIKPYLHEKYRTVNPEEVIGVIPKNIVSSTDLITQFGSNLVSSSLNFSDFGIVNGDAIFIEEPGFDIAGYLITLVNGNNLTLATSMPASITNGKFSVNKVSFPVQTEVDIYPNIAISLLHSFDGYTDGYTTDGYDTIGSTGFNFITHGVHIGDLIRIENPAFEKHYTILNVAAHSLIVNDPMPITASGLTFHLYHNNEEEIPGLRAVNPAYELSESPDGYFTDTVSIRDKALINDIVLLRTLGVNHRRIRRQYYVWGNNSNILKTRLPSPISLNETNIYRILLPRTQVNDGYATLGGGGVWTSGNIPYDRPSNSIEGRTFAVTIAGINIDFTVPVMVEIHGTYINPITFAPTPIIETLSFPECETLFTAHKFVSDGYINVQVKPIDPTKNFLNIDIKERYSLTRLEHDFLPVNPNAIVPQPVIRYSYPRYAGFSLHSDGYQAADGYVVTDGYAFFSDALLDDYLVISSPNSVAGYYQITGISDDHQSLTISSFGNASVPVSAFTDGYYEILHTIYDRSGLQNGFFTFEYSSLPQQPYALLQGLYELDYYTYLNIPLEMHKSDIIVGNDITHSFPLNGTLDELQILSLLFTDTRIGEINPPHQRSITKDFNSVHAPIKDAHTLVLQHFDTLPLINDADIFVTAEKDFIQADVSVNANFNQSICFTNKGLIVDNRGIIDPRKEGTIEFWINPLFDTNNDPNIRFYFDATNAVSITQVSLNSTTIVLDNPAASILSIYSINDQSVNFVEGSVLQADNKTILLHHALPYQNTHLSITYIPAGFQGDRLSIFKDEEGFINFLIIANQKFYQLRGAAVWPRNSWHRIKASFSVNNGHSLDEMHLFMDGYERSNFTFGSGFTYGGPLTFGTSYLGPNKVKNDILFKDLINQFAIGSDFNNHHSAAALIDNLRISNIARPFYQPFGEPLDPNYTTNTSMAFPITEDLYTTYMLNFDTVVHRTEDFTILRNKHIGLADFNINIFDSLDIVSQDARIKDIIEALIEALKPANARAFLAFK